MSDPVVKILNGALDTFTTQGQEHIVLRGVIDPKSFHNLLSGPYQREAMSVTANSPIVTAIGKGEPLPDIEIGMRGQRFFEQGEDFTLRDPCYIIDGLQRITAARFMLNVHADLDPRLGCLVHFDTNEKWERKRFETLNMGRTRVSASVLLRNMRHDQKLIAVLYGLSNADKEFALYKRVCWHQRFSRGELINANALLRVASRLHSRIANVAEASNRKNMNYTLSQIEKEVGLGAWRENIKTFFEIVDKAWGIRDITVEYPTPHLKSGSLLTLADIFADHMNFWGENDRLEVDREDINKLNALKLSDPNLLNLVGAQGAAQKILYALMRDHLNKGRSIRKLQERAA